MRVLLIEDDDRMAKLIVKGLKQAGYSVDHTDNGNDGYDLLSGAPYDAAIVDILLPGLDGLTLVESVRRQQVKTPVIFLSAKREVDDRVKGLRIGGDDYLVKPFAFAELLARLQVQIRRASDTTDGAALSVGELKMDLDRHCVSRAGYPIELTALEFRLLEYLMRNAGRVVSKTMIMEHVWDFNFDPETNVVEACICRLRSRLNEGFEKTLIRTVRGVGYVLDSAA